MMKELTQSHIRVAVKNAWNCVAGRAAPEGTDEARRQTGLLELLLVCILVGGAAAVVAPFLVDPAMPLQLDLPTVLPVVALLVIAGLSGVNRLGYYRVAAFLAVFSLSAAAFGLMLLSDRPPDIWILSYLVLSVLVGSMFLSIRLLAVVILVDLTGLLLLPLILREVDFAEIPAILFATVSALILLARRHREVLERIGRSQLRESEERYKAIAKDMPVMVCRFLPGNEITYVNDAYCKAFDRTPEDLVGSSFLSVIPEAERETVMADISALTPASPTQSHEHRVIGPGGNTRWHRWSYRALFDTKGRLVAYQFVGEDISERKDAEAALGESEERFRMLVENSPVGVMSSNVDGETTYANPAMCAVLQVDHPGELLGNGWKQFFCPESLEMVEREGEKRLKGIASTYEMEVAGKEGAKRSLIVSGAPLLAADGEFLGTIATFVDITERKRAEEELERVLHVTGERVKELRCMYGVAESIRKCETLEQIFEEVVVLIPPGWHCPEIARCRIRFDDQEYVSQPFEEIKWRQSADIIVAGEPRGTIEVFYVDAFHLEKCPAPDGGPFVKEERDLIDGIARALSEAIEHHQAEANREKAEAQLRQSQKMEAVGQLAGGVAHDFNNLLQAILGYGDMALAEAGPDSPVHACVEEMLKAGNRAATLVRQLLAFSRRQVLDMKDVNLNDVIADLMRMIRRVIGEHIKLDVIAAHDLGIVCADPGQIEQILINLCVNARDAMDHGGTITIETENVRIDEAYCESHTWAKPGRYALLSVSDMGCGMDEETLANAFEPFFTTKAVGEGTGLGLSTVYGLVKQHDGMIHVYSEVGKGTTFKIYLPLIERSAACVGDKIEGSVPGGTETILLAEDDVTVRALSQAFLERAGYTVLTAADGEEAVLIFDAHGSEIGLALLDLMMPKVDGKGVFEHIRRQAPQTRVIFSSGYSTNAIHTNFVLDEGLHLIQKPYQRNDLLRRVREVLDEPPSISE